MSFGLLPTQAPANEGVTPPAKLHSATNENEAPANLEPFCGSQTYQSQEEGLCSFLCTVFVYNSASGSRDGKAYISQSPYGRDLVSKLFERSELKDKNAKSDSAVAARIQEHFKTQALSLADRHRLAKIDLERSNERFAEIEKRNKSATRSSSAERSGANILPKEKEITISV
jgi:hypothetical protein